MVSTTTRPRSTKASDDDPPSVWSTFLPTAWTSFHRRLADTYGAPFLICICAVYFAQGFRSLSALHVQLHLKDDRGLGPDALQSLLSVAGLPWSCKPLYGLVSDAIPLFGTRRRSWLRLGAALGVASWIGLAFASSVGANAHAGASGGAASSSSTRPFLVLLALSNLSTALSDVVVDAMVAERAAASSSGSSPSSSDDDGGGDRLSAEEGENALQSACWGALALGGLVGSLVGAALPPGVPPWPILLATGCCPLLVLASSAALDEEEEAVVADDAGAGGGIRARVVDLVRALMTPRVRRPLAFFFLQNAVVPSCSAAMMFFVTEDLGFTSSFLSANGAIAYVALLAGSAAYPRIFGGGDDNDDGEGNGKGKGAAAKGTSFRSVFFRTQLAAAALSTADLVLVSRANLRLGIPDGPFVMASDAAATLVSRLAMQPFLVLSARLCPKGSEGSVFAFFMSTWNFGSTVGEMLGAWVTEAVGAAPGGDRDGLRNLLALRTACMLLPLPLVGALIPEEIDADGGDGERKGAGEVGKKEKRS